MVQILAGIEDAVALEQLFGRRGFDVGFAPTPGRDAAAVIVDLRHASARAALARFASARPRPVLVGILDGDARQPSWLDAAFEPPVDRARLFVRVVELVARRRGARRPRQITGVIGVIDGNDLFLAVTRAIEPAVPRVCAGAVLEAALRELRSGPFIVNNRDVAALLASGHLARALERFADETTTRTALRQVAKLVRGFSSSGEIHDAA